MKMTKKRVAAEKTAKELKIARFSLMKNDKLYSELEAQGHI